MSVYFSLKLLINFRHIAQFKNTFMVSSVLLHCSFFPLCITITHWFANWPSITEGKERPKKDTVHFKSVGGRFNKWGNLHMWLVLGSPEMSRSLHLLAKISLCFSLSQGYDLKNGSGCGNGGQIYIPRTGKGLRKLWLPGSSSQVTSGHILSMTPPTECYWVKGSSVSITILSYNAN